MKEIKSVRAGNLEWMTENVTGLGYGKCIGGSWYYTYD